MSIIDYSHEHFMKQALAEAQKAFDRDEVPVGAIITIDNQLIAKAHNLTEQLNDATAHAEMQAITSAANYLGSKYLNECTLYVTLEPCTMCAGALFWSQIGNIVYGASDEKRGFQKHPNKILHPKTKIVKGVMENECSKILQDFFKQKR